MLFCSLHWLCIPFWFTGLQKLTALNVEGCNITAASFESISGKKKSHFIFLNFSCSGSRRVMLELSVKFILEIIDLTSLACNQVVLKLQ